MIPSPGLLRSKWVWVRIKQPYGPQVLVHVSPFTRIPFVVSKQENHLVGGISYFEANMMMGVSCFETNPFWGLKPCSFFFFGGGSRKKATPIEGAPFLLTAGC